MGLLSGAPATAAGPKRAVRRGLQCLPRCALRPAFLLLALPVVALLAAWRIPGTPLRRWCLSRMPDRVLRFEMGGAPRDAWPYFLLGMRQARRGDLRGGLRLVRASVALAPRAAEPVLGLAEIQMNLGNPAAALAAARRAVEIDPRNAAAHRVFGEMALDAGKSLLAEEELREAVRLDPRDADGWLLLGSLYSRQQGGAARARESLEQSVRLAPHSGPARRDLAALLIRYGAFADAEQHIREALRLAPSDPVAHAALGAILRRGERSSAASSEAETELRRATALDPAAAGAHYELGLLLADGRRWADARSSLEAATRLAPENQGAWYHLAAVQERLRDPRAAAEARQRFRLLAETQAELAELMARIDRQPGNAALRVRIARLHVRRQEWPDAVEELNLAFQAAPQHPGVRALLAELRKRGMVRAVPSAKP